PGPGTFWPGIGPGPGTFGPGTGPGTFGSACARPAPIPSAPDVRAPATTALAAILVNLMMNSLSIRSAAIRRPRSSDLLFVTRVFSTSDRGHPPSAGLPSALTRTRPQGRPKLLAVPTASRQA